MKQKLFITVILILGIIAAVNLLSSEFYMRVDLTETGQYTLSDATKNILRNLEEPVTVKAYFSENLPAGIGKTKQDFQDLLLEFSDLAEGMLLYEFIDPGEKQEYEQEATASGIQPVLIDVREKDQVKQQRAFLGAKVFVGDREEVLPVIQPNGAIEYDLATAIKKISIEEKPVVGILQGHGEPSLAEMQQLQAQLEILYSLKPITLTDSADIPDDIQTLAIIRPTDSISSRHLAIVDRFLARGGDVFVAINRVSGDLSNLMGSLVNTGLETWLRTKGLMVKENFLIDARCGMVSVPQQLGMLSIQTRVPFYWTPIISNFTNHPISMGLESMALEFASSIEFTGDSTIQYTPLAFSSELSDVQGIPVYFDFNREWKEEDFTQQHLPVAAVLEGPLGGKEKASMVVIADGDFVVNGMPQQPRNRTPDNINFVSNAIDWLADDTGLIQLRTKGVTSRPIKELESGTRSLLKYTNFLLPLFLTIVCGIFIAEKNRRKRTKRMVENYEKDE